MKQVIALILALAVATPAVAGGRDHHYRNYNHYNNHRHHGHGDKWIAPLIGGVILGAVINEANKPKEKVVKEVVVQAPPVTVTKIVVCTEWKEIMTSSGQIYKERTCTEQ
jgi:hypothetical protein